MKDFQGINPIGTKPTREWMNPLNKIIWHKAFKNKDTLVTIKDGRKFKCDYNRRPGYVWVSPANKELTPCGWFFLEEVVKSGWIGAA